MLRFLSIVGGHKRMVDQPLMTDMSFIAITSLFLRENLKLRFVGAACLLARVERASADSTRSGLVGLYDDSRPSLRKCSKPAPFA